MVVVEPLPPSLSLFQQNTYAQLLLRHYGVKISRMFLLKIHPLQKGYVLKEVPDISAAVQRAFVEREEELATGAPPRATIEGLFARAPAAKKAKLDDA